ncbi:MULTISPECIES: GNAT family N-acetyltransferase [Mesorhizobium]|uniref:GNAT family N-acetyltransferase n=1 Tax=Mesorhizobium denitrificans TaxID=2294114 RepID=A0A371XJD5_9HYPH|nr:MULTISPECIES: GNAT family N-acetyltransferase [Mesorhizobium]RFC69323.1 GNAT family N-acetyltransferase [Mesorhizobium denitrificans]
MRIPFLSRDYVLEALDPKYADMLAELHREDFVRSWSAEEFSSLLAEEPVFGFVAREVGYPNQDIAGFVLAREAAGEAEILTVAVARSRRREGLGWRLMDAVLRKLHADRAEALFLEVDETNLPAVGLYRRLGFHQVGKRPNYYESKGPHGRTNALVMRRDLR